MIARAAEILEVKENELVPFDTVDHFNGDNRLEGFLCRRSDHRYGALVIFSVKGVRVDPQVIYATPKLRYPFGTSPWGERVYNFPKFSKVCVYQKHDGTNILNYRYVDADGKRYSTFKTRLTAVVQESTYGPFVTLLKEMFEKYPQIREPSCVMSGRYFLSYELFGYRNPHLIEYKESLDIKLLFGVDQYNKGMVSLPQRFSVLGEVVLKIEKECDNSKDLIEFYNDSREEVFKTNVKNDEGAIVGSEGYVFYVLTELGKWEQFKCKSEDIEAIHWSAAEGLPMSIILPTVWNALESCDNLTVDYVLVLLREEYDESLINRAYSRIEKAVAQVLAQIAWRKKVKECYDSTGLDFNQNTKRDVMSALSKSFQKCEMKKVFTALKKLNLIS